MGATERGQTLLHMDNIPSPHIWGARRGTKSPHGLRAKTEMGVCHTLLLMCPHVSPAWKLPHMDEIARTES